jgi:hypothetical protein
MRLWTFAYQFTASILIVLAGAMGGAAVGLMLTAPDASGFEGLGAAFRGFFFGGIVGLVGAGAFLFAPLPKRAAVRWGILAGLAALVVAMLGVQEMFD